jgi:hypothetical protein
VIYLSHKDTKTSHLKGEINMSKKKLKKPKNMKKAKGNISPNL